MEKVRESRVVFAKKFRTVGRNEKSKGTSTETELHSFGCIQACVFRGRNGHRWVRRE